MGLFKKKQFNPGSANFESHYFEVTPEYIKVKPSKRLFVFYAVFIIIGLSFPCCFLFAESDPDESILPVVIFGFIFFAVGAGLWAKACMCRYPYIDLRQRIFYPLGKAEGTLPDMRSAMPLSEAERIELSSRVVRSSKNSYTCYTLRLVYPGENEYILLNHGSLKAFMRDAKLLAHHTGLPLPEDDFEEKIRLSNLKAAPVALIFGLIWTGMSLFIHLQTWKTDNFDWFSTLFSGSFVLIGVVLIGTALKLLIDRFRSKQ